MSTFSGSVLSALDAFSDDYKAARTSNGGAQRPPKGNWDNIIKSIDVETDDVKLFLGSKGSGVEVPAFSVSFNYAILDTSAVPPEMKPGQEWPGKTFIFPIGGLKALPATCTAGKRKNLEISLERLKGHLHVILEGKETGNLSADISTAASLVSDPSRGVAVKVQCQYRQDAQDATKEYFEEYLMGRLS